MKKFNKLFKVGTFVKIEGQDNFNQITEINESRKLIKINNLEGSFQRVHVVKFTNKVKSVEKMEFLTCGVISQDFVEKFYKCLCEKEGDIFESISLASERYNLNAVFHEHSDSWYEALAQFRKYVYIGD